MAHTRELSFVPIFWDSFVACLLLRRKGPEEKVGPTGPNRDAWLLDYIAVSRTVTDPLMTAGTLQEWT